MSEPTSAVAQELPAEIAATAAQYDAKLAEVADINAELARLDKLMAEYGATLNEMRETHAAKGRERHELQRSAARLHAMMQAGCAVDGIDVPRTPAIGPAADAPPAHPPPATTGPAAAIEDALNSGPLAVLGDPSATADDPAGGDEPAPGPFHRGHRRDR